MRKRQERLLAALNDSSLSLTNKSLLENDDSLIDDILALDETQSSCMTTMLMEDDNDDNSKPEKSPLF